MTADQLRAALKRAGLTQRALAERLGVAPYSVTRWVHGTHPVPRYAEAYVELLAAVRHAAR